MSALFTLPKQIPLSAGAILPGAKLTFSQTLTSTLQNTYQDNARVTPHANPVVADANGVFAPIYLDPTLPDYRVKLTTSADVLIYQVDGVPSNQNTQQSIRLESPSPSLLLFDTDGTANQRKFRLNVSGNTFSLQLLNDAETVSFTAFSCIGGAIDMNAGATMGSIPIAPMQNGHFTAAYTGFTTSPTEFCTWEVTGGIAVLQLTGVSATSNAASLTITGLSDQLKPAATRSGLLCRVVDNGTTSIGTASVSTSGIVTFGLGVTSAAFTNAGTKAVLPCTLVYRVNSNG